MAERSGPSHTDQIGMDPKSGNARRIRTGEVRNACASLIGLAGYAAAFLLLVAPVLARASDVGSDIITPRGWEQRPLYCAPATGTTRSELMTPNGWGDGPSATPVTWGAPMCSELVIPADWTHARN